MALRIAEFFGYPPGDQRGADNAAKGLCPFVQSACIKPKHGSCSLKASSKPDFVICCPNRLYADNFAILDRVCNVAFGVGTVAMTPSDVLSKLSQQGLDGSEVAVFGRYWGGELPLPKASAGSGSYFVDWILAKVSKCGTAREITALEVQTIDTTGSYIEQAKAYFAGAPFADAQGRSPGYSNAGFNWENVNKRILPQVIYKGHVLRREPTCSKGMFFACPQQVFDKIADRLGGVNAMHTYVPSSGTVTFLGYSLDPSAVAGQSGLVPGAQFTTTVDQVALAFASPKNLPPERVFEQAITSALEKLSRKRK